jgi:hypothetical protein
MVNIEMVLLTITICAIVYITARSIFLAYFTARSAYIKQLLEIAKEMKSNG